MSGGANKKKPNRTQGWEEAGLEFYQESYPSNPADFDVLQQNPKHLATLLPSKQNRAVTTMRMRTNTDTRTFRRQQSARRESTVRRASTAAEVQVAMMPDLSQNLSNEETTWEEIMELKAMPIPMSQKRELKSKKQKEPNLRLQGFEQFKWKRKKMFERLHSRVKETYQKLELWRGTLKNIEGNFGTGIVAYFLFIKWLMFLNLSIFILIFTFVILPTILAESEKTNCDFPIALNTSKNIIVDLFQGTGIVEETLFFYGAYPNVTLIYEIRGEKKLFFNLPLSYIALTVVYFLISLVAIVKAAARGFKERLVEGEGQFYHYCNLIFGSWDFCIDKEKSARQKQEAIYKEITSSLEIERMEEERKNRTRDERTKIVTLRIFVNILVVIILLVGAALIYYIFDYCTKEMKGDGEESIFGLIYEYLPSVSIVMLNLTLPFAFQYLASLENYSPIFVVRLTLIRTIFLRLFSLFVLYASLYTKISEKLCCWETFVGQQMYKLAITDFAIHIFITFLVNFVRSRIGKLENKFARFIGLQYFDLPKHVLDVVYLQTVCWFGTFYSPFLPLMFTLIFFVMFYIKKFACLVNSEPSLMVYRASRSNSMFMIVLLVSFIFALLPITFTIAELPASKNCGPFRNLTSSWNVVIDAFSNIPFAIQNVLYFLTTPAFGIPAFLFLCLVLYYYIAVTAANRHMVIVLKHQLVLEGHDKQFLLEKLSSFIKQQQQIQKRNRQQIDLRDGDRNVASN